VIVLPACELMSGDLNSDLLATQHLAGLGFSFETRFYNEGVFS
jgi:hypothetical protein